MHRRRGRKACRKRDVSPARAALESGMFRVAKTEPVEGHATSKSADGVSEKREQE